PRAIDLATLRRKIAREPFRSALLRAWLTEEPEGVLALLVADEPLVAAITRSRGPVTTDDDNVLEFAFARNVNRRRILGVESLLGLSMQRGADRAPVLGEPAWWRVAELRPRAFMRSARPPKLRLTDRSMKDRVESIASGCQSGEARTVLAQWSAGGGLPHDSIERFVLGR